MNDHFSPVGKPAPPRPRWPEAFTSLTIQSRPFSRIALVPSQAPRAARAFEAPVVPAVEIGEDAVLVVEHRSVLGLVRCRLGLVRQRFLHGGLRRDAILAPSRTASSGAGASRLLASGETFFGATSVRLGCTSARMATLVVERGIGQRGVPADRRRELAVDLRAGLTACRRRNRRAPSRSSPASGPRRCRSRSAPSAR